MRLGGPYLALSRIQTQLGVLNRLALNRLGGLNRPIVVLYSLKPLENMREIKNAIDAAILNCVLDRD